MAIGYDRASVKFLPFRVSHAMADFWPANSRRPCIVACQAAEPAAESASCQYERDLALNLAEPHFTTVGHLYACRKRVRVTIACSLTEALAISRAIFWHRPRSPHRTLSTGGLQVGVIGRVP